MSSLEPSDDQSETEGTTRRDLRAQDLFEVLSHPGNRYVLTYLLKRREAVPWYEIVEYVVKNTDVPAEFAETEFRGRIATELLDRRLPELAEHGFVEYGRGDVQVRATDRVPLARPYLELAVKQGL